MSDWQPIETIPDSVRCVLVWDRIKRHHIMRADDYHAKPRPYFTNALTHWMPLPAPPVGPEKTKDNSDSALSVSPLEKPTRES